MGFDADRPYCLVLSGGGAKGVYHIGVRRALRELGVPIGACVGNSVGALIAAFIAQGLDEALEEIGGTIGLGTILELPAEPAAGQGEAERLPAFERIMRLYRSLVEKGGLDTAPQRTLLERHLDERAIRAGGIDLGLVTVNLSELQPVELFLEDMEEGSLVDWLMASSAFPGFALPEIGGKRFVDGGLYDNLPYELARKRGYRRIIVVDVQGAGINRKPDIAGTETVYIRNSIDMGGVLDFDRAVLADFNRLGYLDTMRAFSRLEGYSYFLRPDPGLERAFRASHPGLEESGPGASGGREARLFPERMRHDPRLLQKLLDCAAKALEVLRLREYGYRELADEIAARKREEDVRAEAILAGGRSGRSVLDRLLREAIRTRRFEGTPYFYARLAAAFPEGAARGALEHLLGELCPELRAATAWFALSPGPFGESASLPSAPSGPAAAGGVHGAGGSPL